MALAHRDARQIAATASLFHSFLMNSMVMLGAFLFRSWNINILITNRFPRGPGRQQGFVSAEIVLSKVES
jgi:hypothetical protein